MDKKTSDSWTMFSTSAEDVKEMFVSVERATIGGDFLKIGNYPFEPSIAYRQKVFTPDQIDDIDLLAYPLTIRINDELIFLTGAANATLPRKYGSEIRSFAKRNNIKSVERREVWGWILEPFLDTEFTPENDQKATQVLESYGLTTDQVKSLRAEVETQMLKYNFGSMLWEWCHLGTYDVLKAMRPKYNKDEFRDFYQRVMAIALLSPK
jgi:hypothetical protein